MLPNVVLALLTWLVWANVACAVERLPSPVILLDMSNGASALIGNAKKHQLIKSAPAFFVRQASDEQPNALMKMGSSIDVSCQSADLIKSFDEKDPSEAAELLRWLIPSGKSAIVQGLRSAAQINAVQTPAGSVVLLATGGDDCGPDICKYGKEHAERHAFTPIHVIGVGLDAQAERDYLCLSQETGGAFFNVSHFSQLEEAVNRISIVLTQPIELPEEKSEEIDPLIALLGESGGFLRGSTGSDKNNLLGVDTALVEPVEIGAPEDGSLDALTSRRQQYANSAIDTAPVTGLVATNTLGGGLGTNSLKRREKSEGLGQPMTAEEVTKLEAMKGEFSAREAVLEETEVALKARRRLIRENSSLVNEGNTITEVSTDVKKIDRLVALGNLAIEQNKRRPTTEPRKKVVEIGNQIERSLEQKNQSEDLAQTTDALSDARIERTKKLRQKVIEKIQNSRTETNKKSSIQVLTISETAEVAEGLKVSTKPAASSSRLDQVKVLLDKAFSDDRAVKALLGRLAVKEEEDASFQRPLQKLSVQIDRVGSELPTLELNTTTCRGSNETVRGEAVEFASQTEQRFLNAIETLNGVNQNIDQYLKGRASLAEGFYREVSKFYGRLLDVHPLSITAGYEDAIKAFRNTEGWSLFQKDVKALAAKNLSQTLDQSMAKRAIVGRLAKETKQQQALYRDIRRFAIKANPCIATSP